MADENTSSSRSLILNLGAGFVSYLVTFGISFFLSPYIVEKVGVEAYGFVGLANNFVSYASLITIALNALAGRFITVKIYEKDYDGANRYFTSVLIANAVISAGMMLIMSIIWVFLDDLINIPSGLVADIRVLFAALFLSCIMNTVFSVYSVSTFASNKLYLGSIVSIVSSILRAVILICLYFFFSPLVCYLGITTLLMSIYCIYFYIHFTHKLLPFIKVDKSFFSLGAVKMLVASGIWALIIRLGQLLSDGLDLLISNLMIDPAAMGVLSLAKTIPAIITSIIGTLVSVFAPNFTILYARNKKEELITEVRRSMKIMGIIGNLPIIVLIVCGKEFFALWQPTQNASELQLLSILTCCGYIVSGGINCLYDLFTVVNRIKENAIAVLIAGGASIIITLILLSITDLGIVAIAATSTFVSIIRNLAFTAPFGAKCLDLKWYSFYPEIIRPVIFVAISIAAGYGVLIPFSQMSWGALVIKAAAVGIISVVIGFYIILNKNERAVILSKGKGLKNKLFAK